MTFSYEVFPPETYAREVAGRITDALPVSGSVVVTGGSTIAQVYPELEPEPWQALEVLFSDERCVPPDHEASNFRMATELVLRRTQARVQRMPGELDPPEGACRYHDQIQEAIGQRPAFAVLGVGADCHICGLFPGSPALDDPNYCAAVSRPDGLMGLTLTPTAVLSARTIRLVVTGASKAEAVARIVTGSETPETCPARVLADHEDAALWLDEQAAAQL